MLKTYSKNKGNNTTTNKKNNARGMHHVATTQEGLNLFPTTKFYLLDNIHKT